MGLTARCRRRTPPSRRWQMRRDRPNSSPSSSHPARSQAARHNRDRCRALVEAQRRQDENKEQADEAADGAADQKDGNNEARWKDRAGEPARQGHVNKQENEKSGRAKRVAAETILIVA